MHASILLGLLSTLLFGLRHGVDYDHIAAITDITSGQQSRRESVKLGLFYAAGHGAIVLALGTLAVFFGSLLPVSIDSIMERFVGATLILLGCYVIWNLVVTPRENFQMMGRYKILIRLYYKLSGRPIPNNYMPRSAFIIGIIHGIGAETPTQLGLFLFAAGVGGRMLGFAGVLLFVLGVLITNMMMSALSADLFQRSTHRQAIYRGIAGITAAYSLAIGTIFLFGFARLLPSL
ncbi:MAG TPA: hypothetical protein VG537_08440 [Candidatus Kapabacteria bacterium]|jgi:high-affinity nickel-transport protein|nr:hypothetical protein [Candidatus Kapabacteria bacterium]